MTAALQSGKGQVAAELLGDMAVLQQHISSRVDGATAAMLQVGPAQSLPACLLACWPCLVTHLHAPQLPTAHACTVAARQRALPALPPASCVSQQQATLPMHVTAAR